MSAPNKAKPVPIVAAAASQMVLASRIESIKQEFSEAMGWSGLQLKPAEFDGLVRAYATDKPLAIEAITKIIAHRLRLDFLAKEREETDAVDRFF